MIRFLFPAATLAAGVPCATAAAPPGTAPEAGKAYLKARGFEE